VAQAWSLRLGERRLRSLARDGPCSNPRGPRLPCRRRRARCVCWRSTSTRCRVSLGARPRHLFRTPRTASHRARAPRSRRCSSHGAHPQSRISRRSSSSSPLADSHRALPRPRVCPALQPTTWRPAVAPMCALPLSRCRRHKLMADNPASTGTCPARRPLLSPWWSSPPALRCGVHLQPARWPATKAYPEAPSATLTSGTHHRSVLLALLAVQPATSAWGATTALCLQQRQLPRATARTSSAEPRGAARRRPPWRRKGRPPGRRP